MMLAGSATAVRLSPVGSLVSNARRSTFPAGRWITGGHVGHDPVGGGVEDRGDGLCEVVPAGGVGFGGDHCEQVVAGA